MPSKRPHTMIAPSPSTSARTRAWVSGAPRGDISRRGALIAGRCVRVEAGGEYVGAHHHAGAAASGRVVDRAMAADAVRADVVRRQPPEVAREPFTGERKAERARKHRGKEREDIGAPHQDAPSSPSAATSSGGAMTTRRAATSIVGTTALVKG